MQSDDLILVEEFCNKNNVAFSFISSLQQVGLVEITSVDQSYYISQSDLKRLEQLIRLHYDLQINLEGIDAITHLLNRIQNLQTELAAARNRLRLYEDF